MIDEDTSPKHMKASTIPSFLLTNRQYDVLTDLVQLFLPALGTFYFTIAQFWGLPNAEAVVGTLAALAVLLGVALKISKKTYNASDAALNVTDPSR